MRASEANSPQAPQTVRRLDIFDRITAESPNAPDKLDAFLDTLAPTPAANTAPRAQANNPPPMLKQLPEMTGRYHDFERIEIPKPVPQSAPVRSLPSGSWIAPPRNASGKGELAIDNGTDFDAQVKLVSQDVPRTVFWVVYVAAMTRRPSRKLRLDRTCCASLSAETGTRRHKDSRWTGLFTRAVGPSSFPRSHQRATRTDITPNFTSR